MLAFKQSNIPIQLFPYELQPNTIILVLRISCPLHRSLGQRWGPFCKFILQDREWKIKNWQLFDLKVGLTQSMLGRGGADSDPPKFSSITTKRQEILKRNSSDFDFTPLTVILHILSIANVIICCHSNLLFPVCQIISWVEKTNKLELFSR